MKQKLTFLMLALLACMGAWAATPASTPTNGKYYYIYAKPTSDVSGSANYYLYYNGSKLTITSSLVSSSNSFVWKCIDNGGSPQTFDFQNASTNTYLGWQEMSALAFNWKLDGTVTSTSANTLINKKSGHGSNGYYLVTYCTSGKSKDFDRNSSWGSSTAWTSDYVFVPLKNVTFDNAVSVNGGDAVTSIYVATDGTDVITLDANKYYTINEVGMYASAAATAITATGASDISVSVSDLPTYTVTYTCENLSGYQLASSTQDCAFFVPPTIEGYTVDGVYDETEAEFDYENTMIVAAKTLKLKYRLTTNPFETAKSTVANPTWYTMRLMCGYGNYMITWDGTYVRHNTLLGTYPISNNYLWCFEGNETDGYYIYNKGQSKYLGPSSTDEASTGNPYLDLFSSANTKWTLIYRSGNYELYSITGAKFVNRSSNRAHYWATPIDKGGITLDNALTLYQTNYPYATIVNAAGCVGSYAVAEVDAAKTAVSNTEPTTVDNYAAFVAELGDKLTLTSGNYYRIHSACSELNTNDAWYYKPSVSEDYFLWAEEATAAEHQVNSLFKFTGSGTSWTIYSPNAQKSMATGNGTFDSQNGGIDAVGAPVTVNGIGSAQYTFKQSGNYQTLYALSGGYLWTWNANDIGGRCAWYIESVDAISITLNSDGAVSPTYYATLCLPFDATISGADAFTLSKSGSYLVPTAVTDNEVPAGTPVLLKGTSSSATATINTGAAFNSGSPLACDLTGTYTDMSVTKTEDVSDDYFLGKDGTTVGFYKWDGSTLKANRAYLDQSTAEAAVKGYILMFDDDATSINSLTPALSEGEGAIFNLAGQRVSRMQKGINIVNGKKIMIK